MEDYEYSFESCVRGHHISKEFWSPTLGEELRCEREVDNTHDPYAVAVKKGQLIVGHVPRKISAACSLFLQIGNGSITSTITGNRQYSQDLPQGGLELPCILKFRGESKYIDKIKILLPTAPSEHNDEPPTKKRKTPNQEIIVDEDLEPTFSTLIPSCWVSFSNLILTDEDQAILTEGRELNDKHIHFAQLLIKNQFRNIDGLMSPVLFSRIKPGLPVLSSGQKPAIQILHTRSNHWIVATSNAGSHKVSIYDSLYDIIDNPTKEIIREIFEIRQSIEEIEVTVGAPKQKGVKDCGLFAIAVSTSLAYYYSYQATLKFEFNQSMMRDHLIGCYINRCITPFPTCMNL